MTEEKSNERCPCCDREIRRFRDYPLMQVLSVSIIKPEEVPTMIAMGHHDEDLKEKKVPNEVKDYFKSNPTAQEYAHSDDYVYQRLCLPYDTRAPVAWNRSPNLSKGIRKVVESDPSLRGILSILESMVGRTIPTKDFLNQFGNEDERSHPKKIAEGLYLLLSEGETGQRFRTVQFQLGADPAEMGRLHSEMMYTVALENLATTRYIGKMLK